MSKKKRILLIGAVVIVLAALGLFAQHDRHQSQSAMYATQSRLRAIDSLVLKARKIDPVTGDPHREWNGATARDNIERAAIECRFASSDIDNLDQSHSLLPRPETSSLITVLRHIGRRDDGSSS